MQIIERHKREWRIQHSVHDRVEDGAYIVEKSNLTPKGQMNYHHWTESWKPVEKEVDIDGVKTTLHLLEHKIVYEDNQTTEGEVEYQDIDVKSIINTALTYARFNAERAYNKKGENNAYSFINAIRGMENWKLEKWLSLANRVIG
jgi:hypothetical protein